MAMLPDVALLEIFDSYMDDSCIDAWHTLVHVCRQWRIVVFGSPRRLNLRLHCTARTPVTEMLDVWPLLPIVVSSDGYFKWGKGNIVAALKHNDRICEVDVCDMPGSEFKSVLAEMQQPFTALTRLRLRPIDEIVSVVPDSFLGGSAPRLQSLFLDRIPFPGLPKLLLSTTSLVHLGYSRVPAPWGNPGSWKNRYITTEAVVTSLSMLTKLERLDIGFNCYQPNSCPSPRTRTLLPVLTELRFYGFVDYLGDLVAQIDAPLLNKLTTAFVYQPGFNATSQLTHFVNRTPQFKTHDEARVVFSGRSVSVTFPQKFHGALHLGISCGMLDQQLLSLVGLCRSSFVQALIPMVEHLYIHEDGSWDRQDGTRIEDFQWLELLHIFTAVKDLYISYDFLPLIARALQLLVGEGVTEVLPALQTLFLEETLSSRLVQETIGQFVAARQLASYPIAVSHWERTY
jgi:hypothetical protein